MTLSLRQRILWWSVASSLAILLAALGLVDEDEGGQEDREAAGDRPPEDALTEG